MLSASGIVPSEPLWVPWKAHMYSRRPGSTVLCVPVLVQSLLLRQPGHWVCTTEAMGILFSPSGSWLPHILWAPWGKTGEGVVLLACRGCANMNMGGAHRNGWDLEQFWLWTRFHLPLHAMQGSHSHFNSFLESFIHLECLPLLPSGSPRASFLFYSMTS